MTIKIFKHAILVIKEFNLTSNNRVARINYTLINDGVHSFSFNGTLETLAVFSKIIAYFKLKVPENERDHKFQKQIIATVIDIESSLHSLKF